MRRRAQPTTDGAEPTVAGGGRLLTDGGEERDEGAESPEGGEDDGADAEAGGDDGADAEAGGDDGADAEAGGDDGADADEVDAEGGEAGSVDGGTPGVDRSTVEVTDAGEVEPVDPKWQKPDIDDIPEVEGPKTRPAEGSDSGGVADPGGASGHAGGGHAGGHAGHADDSTAGMPNNARSPGQSRLKEGGADGFVVALELCARLPDDVRLPEEAADLVPVALEAELEQDVQSFAAEEFDNPAPHVERLDFVETDGDVWLRLRLGVHPEAFENLDPQEIREHALQQIDGLL